MSNLSQNSRYRILVKLYRKYRSAIKVIKPCSNGVCITKINVSHINKVMQEIEKFPLSWEFYNKQRFKFSQDFEDLIIFFNEN